MIKAESLIEHTAGWLWPFPKRTLVDSNEIPDLLRQVSEDELDEMREFGAIMITEVLDRIGQIETKAGFLFGYDVAALVFLWFTALSWWSNADLVLKTFFCAAGALSAISALLAIIAFVATPYWAWPSEEDWFPERAFGNLHAIKRRHLDTLLFCHQKQGAMADRKFNLIFWSQRALLLSFIALIVVLILTGIAAIPLANHVGVAP